MGLRVNEIDEVASNFARLIMNRAAFLTTLAGGALALPNLDAAETPSEKAVYDLFDTAMDAQLNYDFPKLVTLLQPASLRMFRDHLSARFDHLLRSYSLEQIASVSGLPKHPEDLDASDADVLIAACNRAKERHPNFVGDPKYLPLKVHGAIFDDDRTAHILFSYSGKIQSERTDFDFLAPRVMTLRRDRDDWQVHSCVLARRIVDDWWRDLATPRKGNQESDR